MIAVALTIALQSASVPAWEARETDGWRVGPSGQNGCSALAIFTNKSTGLNSTFYFSYSQGENRAYLSFQSDLFKSLKEDEEYEIETNLVINDKLDQGWGTKKFTAYHDKNDVGGGLMRPFEGRQMLADLSRASYISFFKNGEMLVSYPLKGSAKIVALVRECAAAVERKNPTDPFAK